MISFSAMPDTKGDANQDSASRQDAIDRPLEYLFTSSGASIESFHLSRLNAVANLRKELHEIFEEWVEAEVQARLAQWLLARKNSETLPAALSLTMGSGEDSNAQIAGTRPGAGPATRSATRTATRPAAAANSATDSATRICIACLRSGGSGDSNTSSNSSMNSSIRGRAVRGKNRAARAVNPKLTTRALIITRSALASRARRFPLFVHPNVALRSQNSKPGNATPTLLSFRRPNRNSMAS